MNDRPIAGSENVFHPPEVAMGVIAVSVIIAGIAGVSLICGCFLRIRKAEISKANKTIPARTR